MPLQGQFEDVHGLIADWLIEEESMFNSFFLPFLKPDFEVFDDICQHGLIAALNGLVKLVKAVRRLMDCDDVSTDGLAQWLLKTHLEVGNVEFCHIFGWDIT